MLKLIKNGSKSFLSKAAIPHKYMHSDIYANKKEHEKEKYHTLSTIVFCCYMTRILHTQFKFTKNAIACDLFMLKYKISFA